MSRNAETSLILLPVNTETQVLEPIPGTALRWVRFPGIAWRTADGTPHRRRADPPRASRFADLGPAPTPTPTPTPATS